MKVCNNCNIEFKDGESCPRCGAVLDDLDSNDYALNYNIEKPSAVRFLFIGVGVIAFFLIIGLLIFNYSKSVAPQISISEETNSSGQQNNNSDDEQEYDSEIDNDNESELIDYGIYKDGHGISSYDYVLPDSDSRYLTRDDVSNLTLRGVNYAKNEIYARYGRDFKSQELKDFFASRYWYSVSYSLSDETDKKITDMFNEYEKENSRFLASIEKEMGTYNLQ